MFQEEGTYYTSHLWITGTGNIAFECSFTVPKGGSAKEAEEVIATLEARKEGEKYPAELIPVRLSEIYQINEGYEWVVSTVKQELKKDFQGVEEDLEKIQQVIDSGKISPKKKDEWLAIGITVCAILTNEVEGMEWKTLIDGNREVPVLEYQGRTIDPMKICHLYTSVCEAEIIIVLIFTETVDVYLNIGSGVCDGIVPVSYTHLDVYKRQSHGRARTCSRRIT